MAEEEGLTASVLDQRLDVLDLSLDGVRLGVPALAAAAAVVVVDGEARCQQGDELGLRLAATGAQGAVHKDQRRPLAGGLVSDGRSVL